MSFKSLENTQKGATIFAVALTIGYKTSIVGCCFEIYMEVMPDFFPYLFYLYFSLLKGLSYGVALIFFTLLLIFPFSNYHFKSCREQKSNKTIKYTWNIKKPPKTLYFASGSVSGLKFFQQVIHCLLGWLFGR